MSRRRNRQGSSLRQSAPVFAALGDETRLSLLAKLGGRSSLSISSLTEGSSLTRQAITKHLCVLREAGLVRSVRCGRENRFELEAGPLREAQETLDAVSRQWDEALARLKAFVEE